MTACAGAVRSSQFPEYLEKYGLSSDLLADAFYQAQDPSAAYICWSLTKPPTAEFYKHLHPYLLQWPVTKDNTKTSFGRFYNAVDPFLRKKSLRPDNAFRYVETQVKNAAKSTSNPTHSTAIVPLRTSISEDIPEDPDNDLQEVSNCVDCDTKAVLETQESDVQEADRVDSETREVPAPLVNFDREALDMDQIQQLEKTISHLEEQLLSSKVALNKAKRTIEVVESEARQLQALLRVDAYDLKEQIVSEFGSFEEESPVFTSTMGKDQLVHFYCETKSGKHYSAAIRKLYYQLLSDLIPPAKIPQIIKAVLRCFLPNADLSQLQLPCERTAGYMRSTELETVCMAHKATHFSEAIQSDVPGFGLNSDGTTLHQRKLGATVVSGICVAVNELPDGCAETIIEDMDSEFTKLRSMAKILKLPNADAINWTLVSSSTADSASTQKKLNNLIEERKKRDESLFGPARFTESKQLVRNFCAMHLAVNLRTAFLQGMKQTADTDEGLGRDRNHVDVLVHQFCKLFGNHGTPEYGAGVLIFPDFLSIQAQVADDPLQEAYYSNCLGIVLERQVGNRYFVTAANAGKVLFLKRAALEYLVKTGKHLGNQLEREIYTKLQDPYQITWLRADALMFYHVYADLVTLAKSNDLEKSVYAMNDHYLELQRFLERMYEHPELATDKSTKVFISEKCLYASDNVLNHRSHKKYAVIQECLFALDDKEKEDLYPLLCEGAMSMKEKLCMYAGSQLPGGAYWNPDENTKKILQQLRPNNDICESILGLNDWITGHIPNIKQGTCSILVQLKRNHTLSWLDELPIEQQDEIVSLAVHERRHVQSEQKAAQETIAMKRKEHIKCTIQRREQKRKAAEAAISHVRVITSVSELLKALNQIDQQAISEKKKSTAKLNTIREQIKVRKLFLNEKIKIWFSTAGKQKPVQQIIEEFANHLEVQSKSNQCYKNLVLEDPSYLVGKRILHKFFTSDTEEEVWYAGLVIDYNHSEMHHTIQYEGEEEL